MKIFYFVIAATVWVSTNVYAEQGVQRKVIEQCVCEQQNWKQVFDQSKHVAFGEVKEIQVHGETLASAPFNVLETFKGDGANITKIVGAAKKGDACHSPLLPGYYIAFGSDSHTVVLNACSPSRLLTKENLVQTLIDIQQYAEMQANQPVAAAQIKPEAEQPEQESDYLTGFLWVLGIVGLLALISLARNLLQRRVK